MDLPSSSTQLFTGHWARLYAHTQEMRRSKRCNTGASQTNPLPRAAHLQQPLGSRQLLSIFLLAEDEAAQIWPCHINFSQQCSPPPAAWTQGVQDSMLESPVWSLVRALWDQWHATDGRQCAMDRRKAQFFFLRKKIHPHIKLKLWWILPPDWECSIESSRRRGVCMM